MSKHILVIGAGVIGLCTAYYCAKRGHRVTVVDKQFAARDGCSFGNAGMVVPSHFVPLAAPGMVAMGLKWMWNPESPFYIKPRLSPELLAWAWKFWRASTPSHVARCEPLIRDLSFASRELFEELSGAFEFGLVKDGLLMLCKTQQTLEHEARAAAHANEIGVSAQVLDAKATAAREPAVTMDVAGSVYFPKDCHLSPNRFMAGIEAECLRLGVNLEWNADLRTIAVNGRRVESVATSRGDYSADEYVVCGGSWSPVMLSGLKVSIPMQAGKGYSLTLPQPRQLPHLCAILTEARVAVTPMGGSLRFGGTMEIAGLNENITPRRVRGIIKAVSGYYPDFGEVDFEGIQPWRGLRPCSPDGMPYVGRFAAYDNVSTATGHAMMGLSLGPITGRLMSDVLAGEKPSHDMTLMNPDRYA